MTSKPTPQFFPGTMTTAEVARMFRVNPRTIHRWTAEGILPVTGITPGGQRRYSRVAMEVVQMAMNELQSQ